MLQNRRYIQDMIYEQHVFIYILSSILQHSHLIYVAQTTSAQSNYSSSAQHQYVEFRLFIQQIHILFQRTLVSFYM